MGIVESKDVVCCYSTQESSQKPSLVQKRNDLDAKQSLPEIRMNVWTSSKVISIKMCEYAATNHADGINHLCEKQGGVIYLNFLNEDGYAPLHLAAMKGACEAAMALVNHGSDASIRSREGLTSSQYARKAGATTLADFLENLGHVRGHVTKNSYLRSSQLQALYAQAAAGESNSSNNSRASWPSPSVHTPSDSPHFESAPLSSGGVGRRGLPPGNFRWKSETSSSADANAEENHVNRFKWSPRGRRKGEDSPSAGLRKNSTGTGSQNRFVM